MYYLPTEPLPKIQAISRPFSASHALTQTFIHTHQTSTFSPLTSRFCLNFDSADLAVFSLATEISIYLSSFSFLDGVLRFFSDLILDVANNFIPRVSSSGKIRLPWWTPSVLTVPRAKKLTNRHWFRSRSRVDWTEHKRASTVT